MLWPPVLQPRFQNHRQCKLTSPEIEKMYLYCTLHKHCYWMSPKLKNIFQNCIEYSWKSLSRHKSQHRSMCMQRAPLRMHSSQLHMLCRLTVWMSWDRNQRRRTGRWKAPFLLRRTQHCRFCRQTTRHCRSSNPICNLCMSTGR